MCPRGRVGLRIVAQTTGTSTVRYSYTGAGDTADYTLTTSNTASEHTLGLPGGVTVSIQGADSGSAQLRSYPNLHGDVVVTPDGTGTRTGVLASYDPFGDPIDPTTGNIGTVPANTATPRFAGSTEAAITFTSIGRRPRERRLC